MVTTTIYDELSDYFNQVDEPSWYEEAVRYLRGGRDSGKFGLFLYNLIKSKSNINTVINIGTARGYSAVCAAAALVDSERTGKVHTIDVLPPDVARDWGANSKEDPVGRNEKSWSMQELVSRFHDPTNQKTPIEFYQGESSTVLKNVNINPDLVFHDGEHTYETVKKDMQLAASLSDDELIQVHDDCYLYQIQNEWHIHNPIDGSLIGDLPLIRRTSVAGKIKRYQYSLTKRKFPGVARAVEERLNNQNHNKVEIVRDKQRLPITVIWE